MYVRMYVCTYVRMYVCTYVRMYVRTYVRMYVHIYICNYTCIIYNHKSSLKIGGWGQGWPLCSGPRVPLYKKGHSKNVPLYKMLCTLFPSTK